VPQSLPREIPSIEQSGNSRESLVNALSNKKTLPSAEIAAATLYADAVEPTLLRFWNGRSARTSPETCCLRWRRRRLSTKIPLKQCGPCYDLR
jgi:hypothetical protein